MSTWIKAVNVLVVDTSVWIDYFNRLDPDPELDLGLKEGRVYLSPIVAAEILSSRLSGHDRKAMIEFLKELPLCDSGFDHWARVGELRARLSAQGINLSTPDAHVAQCALDLEGYLYTRDGVFQIAAGPLQLRLK